MRIIGLIGMGEKGYKLAKALQAQQVRVLAFDPDKAHRQQAANGGIVTTSSISGVVMHLPERKVICLALERRAEAIAAVDSLAGLLQKSDVVVDFVERASEEQGGFSKLLEAKGIHYFRGKTTPKGVAMEQGNNPLLDEETISLLSFLFV